MRLTYFLLAALLFTACVSDSSVPPTGTTPDAGGTPETDAADPVPPNEAGVNDAAVPRCNPASAFVAVDGLAALNTAASENPPFLTDDELHIFFSRVEQTDGGLVHRLYHAERTKVDDPFTPAVLMTNVQGPGSRDHALALRPSSAPNPSTYRALLSSQRLGAPNIDYYWLDISPPFSGQAGAPQSAVGPLNSGGLEGGASFSRDGLRLYHSRYVYPDGGNSGNGDLYIVDINLASETSNLRLVPGPVNTPEHEGDPVVSRDERTLIYSTVTGGRSRIYLSTRASVSDPFPRGEEILPSSFQARAGWLSPDGCKFYFVRGPQDALDLFVATRGN